MHACLCRLVLTGVFAVFLGVDAPASDILLNTDFRDGKTHWEGGGKEPSNMGGKLLVELDPKKWTVIYQHFSTRASVLHLQVVYSLSADCSLVGDIHDGQTYLFTSDNLTDACGLHDDFEDIRVTVPQVGLIFTVSSGAITAIDHIYPNPPTASSPVPPPVTGRRILDTTIERYWGGQFDNDELCLAFPPGEGTVTLLKVELAKIGN